MLLSEALYRTKLTMTNLADYIKRTATMRSNKIEISNNQLIAYTPYDSYSIKIILDKGRQLVQTCYADDGDWLNPETKEFGEYMITNCKTVEALVSLIRVICKEQ